MPSDPANRTLVLSVVAVDLVGYSRKSVAEQMSLKEGFNQVLLQAIRDISTADRIILDTGDGVAMGFLGDPEDALYVAMFMHDAINRDSTGSPSGSLDSNAIRIGINLGPVKLATGAGGHPNIIGDGINVAERIMSFAEPGQLTASRPFYEVMSRMSDHYATLFQFAGAHTDKQVRVHDVYIVGKSSAAFQHAHRGIAERATARIEPPIATHSASPVASLYLAPHKSPPPAPAVAAAKVASTPPRNSVPVTTVDTSSTIEVATAPSTNSLQDKLIDFLEDRNKVATTAMLMGVMVVTLTALLVYRKMPALLPDEPVPTVATALPASPPTDLPPIKKSPAPKVAAPVTVPAPAATKPAVTEVSPVPVTKVEPKAVATKPTAILTPAPDLSAAPKAATVPASVLPANKAQPPPSTSPGAEPKTAQTAEGAPPTGNTAGTAASITNPVTTSPRDKPKDTRVEKTDKSDRSDRGGVREEPRKPATPRSAVERAAPGTTVPVVPAFQSPVEAPRTDTVSPTPAPTRPPPAAPAAPADDTVNLLTYGAPKYPVEATRQGITAGLVKARITVDANGNVSDVVIIESRPISAFGRETRIGVQQWKYNRGTPGRIHEIEMAFKP